MSNLPVQFCQFPVLGSNLILEVHIAFKLKFKVLAQLGDLHLVFSDLHQEVVVFELLHLLLSLLEFLDLVLQFFDFVLLLVLEVLVLALDVEKSVQELLLIVENGRSDKF